MLSTVPGAGDAEIKETPPPEFPGGHTIMKDTGTDSIMHCHKYRDTEKYRTIEKHTKRDT